MSSFPGASFFLNGIFLFCLATVAAGALLAVFSARLIRSVCGLAVCSVGLAGLYYFLHSPFLALMEILIYIGAVCVTIVFAIMLAEPEEPASVETPVDRFLWGGLALGTVVALFCAVVWLGTQRTWVAPATTVTDGSIASIGISLLTTYSLPFELISLALLVAILGALAIARMGRGNPEAEVSSLQPGQEHPVLMPDDEVVRPVLDGAETRAEVETAISMTAMDLTRHPITHQPRPALEQSRPV